MQSTGLIDYVSLLYCTIISILNPNPSPILANALAVKAQHIILDTFLTCVYHPNFHGVEIFLHTASYKYFYALGYGYILV